MNPFQELTVDGKRLRGQEIIAWTESLIERTRHAPWTIDLRTTCRALVDGEGVLPVRTSGTTGAPKAMELPFADVLASIELTRAAFDLGSGDRALLCLPCEFIGGKLMVARAMVLGLDLHVIDPRGGVMNNLRIRDRFRFATMVPMQLHTALHQDRARVEEQFEMILLGGGPVSNALVDDVRDLRTRIYDGYGSTETVTHIALRKLNGGGTEEYFTTLGNVTVQADEAGRLIADTPHLSTPRHETSDVIEVLDGRHFKWAGRHDHAILSGGRKILPERLEAMTAGVVPYAHFFASRPDERLGQRVVLVVEKDATDGNEREQIIRMVSGMLDEHERPREVIFVPSFVRTPSGKVERARTLAKA